MTFFAQNIPFDISPVTTFVGNACYVMLAAVAVWGAYCCVILWRRIRQLSFEKESHQHDFLAAMHKKFRDGDLDGIREECADDPRAIPQLVLIAINNASMPLAKLRDLLIERFQRDVLAELDHRVTWVQTIIKSAPMLGLYGTVVGMMGAFCTLSTKTHVEPTQLSGDIMFALITTACGLTIAIPLILAIASINIRTIKFEDLAGSGIVHILEWFKPEEKNER